MLEGSNWRKLGALTVLKEILQQLWNLIQNYIKSTINGKIL